LRWVDGADWRVRHATISAAGTNPGRWQVWGDAPGGRANHDRIGVALAPRLPSLPQPQISGRGASTRCYFFFGM
jgi:hypothetical protein